MIERLNAALEDRYRVERELGEGGMATVYLAEDVKHRRKVALKVLRPELAAVVGAERFLAEIETTANLQHPHILPLFDSGEADSFLFYVMPYVEGESLREKLDREHQLPVDEAVELARKVADALQYAHEQGVIHRDIKPANILLSRGNPLVADFGIALAVSQAGGGRITETGLSLGTPHYMSPEQAAGERTLDKRSDVYALGCVLYEMLTGEPPYGGPTSQAVLARILTAEPQRVSELRRTVPANVDAAVARALEKLPADRFATADDFRNALADPAFTHTAGRAAAAAAGSAEGLAARRGIRAPAAWAVPAALGVLLLLSVLGGFALLGPDRDRDTPLATPITRFSVDVGENPIFQSQLDLSHDGRMLVWAPAGGRPLQLRAMDRLETRPLPGTEDGRWPVFSPDGEWVAFLASDGVRKIAVSGGAPLRVTLGVANRVGLHWGDDGTLVYPQSDGIYRVSAQGGEPERILEGGQPLSLRFPRLLPGGEAVLFSETEGLGREVASAIRLLDLATGEVTTLVAEGSDARYVETGHLVYGHRSGALFAAPFDLEKRGVTGSPFPVLDEIRVLPGFGATAFTASRVGTVAYLSGQDPGANRIFVLADTTDGREILPLEPAPLYAPRFSPDGRKLAYERDASIYVYDLEVGTNIRITFEGLNRLPVWTPGGDSIVFASVREGSDGFDLFWAPADGEPGPAPLWTEEGDQYPESWGPDGRLLLYSSLSDEDDDLSVLDLRGDPQTTPYLAADWDERRGRVSPDGRWAAYESDEDGTREIYVRAFPEPGTKWKVSEGGGRSSRWSPDGRELYYWRGDTLMAARVRTEPSLQVVSRSGVLVGSYSHEFDVRPDGGGFVFSAEAPSRTGGDAAEEEAAPDLVVVVNWFEELMRRAGRMGGTP